MLRVFFLYTAARHLATFGSAARVARKSTFSLPLRKRYALSGCSCLGAYMAAVEALYMRGRWLAHPKFKLALSVARQWERFESSAQHALVFVLSNCDFFKFFCATWPGGYYYRDISFCVSRVSVSGGDLPRVLIRLVGDTAHIRRRFWYMEGRVTR